MSDSKNQDKDNQALNGSGDENNAQKQNQGAEGKDNADKGEKGSDAYENQKKRAEAAEKRAAEAEAKAKQLEQDLADKSNSQGEISDADLEKLADEHDVPVELVKGLQSSIVSQASKAAEKLVSDKLSETEKEREKERILNQFQKDFDKVSEEFEGKEISEKAVRMHYLTEKAKNPDHSVSDSVEEIYGSFKSGKSSAENEAQGADPAGEKIDFTELSKDPEKLEKVLKDPKARSKYYDWRDSQGL